VRVRLDQVRGLIASGELCDAKTLIGLMWLFWEGGGASGAHAPA
jgi:hypothetical protein